jgi:hypothetical protein
MRSPGVPLGHKLIAILVAVASACGLYAFLRYREARLASAAALSFDSTEARQLDPGIARSPHPAVVLAQSILSDAAVSSLLSQAGLSASPTPLAIGEFRSSVELTQPTAGLLYVRYRDPDPGQAAATANAVAQALAAWTPSTSGAPPPAASAQPAPAPKPAPAPAPKPAPAASQNPAGPSLAAALGDLQSQLSAADQHFGPNSSLSEHDRQRYLEAQVHDAQQKLGDLRNQFAHSGSAPGAPARFDAIQHALALFWPSAAGMSTAGTSEGQLRYEREQLTNAIAVIERQRQTAQRDEAAQSAPANPPPPQSAPAPQETDLPAHRQSPAPVDSAPPPAAGDLYNPLHLDRMAGLPARVVWWPAALVGCFCGILYWGLAFARYRSSGDYDDELDLPEAAAPSAYRLITTDQPVSPRLSLHDEPPPPEIASHKRASFSFEPASEPPSDPAPPTDQGPERSQASSPGPDPVLATPPETPAVEAVAETHAEVLEEPHAEVLEESHAEALEEPCAEVLEESHAEALETPPAADPADPLPAGREEPVAVFHEKVVAIADPWAEEVRKNLSQTTIGRMLDALIMAEEQAAAKDAASEEAQSPSHSDRLAG